MFRFLCRSSRAQRSLGDHHYYRKSLPLALLKLHFLNVTFGTFFLIDFEMFGLLCRSSRAQRSLGDHYYHRKALPLALLHLEHFFYRSWNVMFLSFLHRSSRAQRALGDHHYYRKALPLAIQHYRLSVACNHLQLPVWQNLAFAALQVTFYCFLFVLLLLLFFTWID